MVGTRGRPNQRSNENLVLPTFDLIFTFHGTRPVRELLGADQLPWPLGFCIIGSALVMTIESAIQVLRGAYIVATVLFGLKDVYIIGHRGYKKRPVTQLN